MAKSDPLADLSNEQIDEILRPRSAGEAWFSPRDRIVDMDTDQGAKNAVMFSLFWFALAGIAEYVLDSRYGAMLAFVVAAMVITKLRITRANTKFMWFALWSWVSIIFMKVLTVVALEAVGLVLYLFGCLIIWRAGK